MSGTKCRCSGRIDPIEFQVNYVLARNFNIQQSKFSCLRANYHLANIIQDLKLQPIFLIQTLEVKTLTNWCWGQYDKSNWIWRKSWFKSPVQWKIAVLNCGCIFVFILCFLKICHQKTNIKADIKIAIVLKMLNDAQCYNPHLVSVVM